MRYFTYVQEASGDGREVGQGTNFTTVERQASDLTKYLTDEVTTMFIRDNQRGKGWIVAHWQRNAESGILERIV
jgi:hypothetical protein